MFDASDAPGMGRFGNGNVFGVPVQAAIITEKRILKNLDLIGARDRVLAEHRARLRGSG